MLVVLTWADASTLDAETSDLLDQYTQQGGNILVLPAVDAREVAGQTIEIFLPPFLEGVVMALSAVHANSQKGLADRLCQVVGGSHGTKKIRGSDLGGIAGCGQQLADPLVVGSIRGNLPTQPTMKFEGPTFTQIL